MARAGLLGNPSDGYDGKTISLTIPQYRAAVTICESDRLEFTPAQDDIEQYDSLVEFSDRIQRYGVYGGIRLLKAACKVFADHCAGHAQLSSKNFVVTYSSNIPRSVGMAGSSAIIVATLKSLCQFYHVAIDPAVMATLALHAETKVLGIPAGLQDRVIQSYEGLVYMDFAKEHQTEREGVVIGKYEPLDPGLLPKLYVAFAGDAGEPTEVVHNDLKQRYEQGDPQVIETIEEIANLADEGYRALQAGDHESFTGLIDRNFDLRQSICPLNPMHVKMVEVARSAGASAKYCGSGGAIIGTFGDEEAYLRLVEDLGRIGCTVFQPNAN